MAAQSLCSIPDCCKPAKIRGWCRTHYSRWQRHGSPLIVNRPGKKTTGACSIEGCDNPHKALGLCGMHYRRWRVHGDPNTVTRTPNGEPERFFREVVLKYVGDDCLIWPYSRMGTGYGQINIPNIGPKHVHRLVCEEVNGPPPTPYHVAAHSCGKGQVGCCNPNHLSWKTQAANMQDRIDHGTSNRCSGKLTENDVREIRAIPRWVPSSLIAKQYGLSARYISDVRRGVAYAWL